MSAVKKLALLLVTLVPAVYTIFAFSSLLSLEQRLLAMQELDESIVLVLVGHLAMMLWVLVIVGWYCRLLYLSAKLNPTQKAVWAVVFVVTAPFGMLVFWYLHVWRTDG